MQNHLEDRVYAGFFVRLIAFAIDSLIAAIAVSVVIAPLSIAAMSGVGFLNANFIFHYTFLDVLDYVGVALYFVLLTYKTHTTPGKAAMGLEVITVDKEWTFINVLYRETIGRFFSAILCIGYFVVLVQEKKQGFHDMLCDTYVVYKNMAPRRAFAMAGVPGSPMQSTVVEEETISMPNTEEHEIGNPTTDVEESVSGSKSEIQAPVYHVKSEPVTYSHDQMNPDCSNLTNLRAEDKE